MGLEHASTVIKVYCVLHNFLTEEGDIGEDEQDKV
jgi:hypothetical protein